MTVTVDREKQIQYLMALEEPEIGLLAVSAHFYVTVRKHPEVGELLSESAAHLVRCVDRFDRAAGGDGIRFDAGWSVETATDLYLALFPNSGRYEPERIRRVLAMLDRLAADARTEVVATQDADLRTRIAAELEQPIPRSIAARLVIPSVTSAAAGTPAPSAPA